MGSNGIDGIIKTCRDIMRRDKGMNTDAQRLPQLLWMLFLKCLDDFESQQELLGSYTPIIKPPYRWRDWSDEEDGPRGEQLIEFVDNNLFKYLRELRGKDERDQRDVITDIFREQENHMTDGYSMKEMINQINKFDFTSSEQFHLIGSVYEKMLLSMRDDSPGAFGEFYTPRPVIKFIVKMIKPLLERRETILDPACGTGGFLVESYLNLEEQVKGTEDNEFLQKQCLHGIEARSDPFLFGIMNLILHGLEEPNIVRTNTLETPIGDIQENMKVDIIMTNPPFGGEESDNIKRKLPSGYQTKDTALGFLLHCIKRLKEGGRCAIILPNGTLFNSGKIAQNIKRKLLQECNLHTIIKLPESVFSPYTPVETNILFFDKIRENIDEEKINDVYSTTDIWYYQLNIREGLKAYSKTNPIILEDFAHIINWWDNRQETENAWKLNIENIVDYNLDIKNPNHELEVADLSAHEIIENIIVSEHNIVNLLHEVKDLIDREIPK